MKTTIPSFGRLAPLTLTLALLLPSPGWAGGVVTSPSEADLRAALAGGGTVTFETIGTITLSSVLAITSNTRIDAAYSVTLSGGNATPVFYVDPNVQFTLNNLTVANGLATNQGGASSMLAAR
ncbi:exported hypothetical protein [Verrucomicrobia bacterium]|nr:exported hypothetical protein [Verrucomicrobiota bacterium]